MGGALQFFAWVSMTPRSSTHFSPTNTAFSFKNERKLCLNQESHAAFDHIDVPCCLIPVVLGVWVSVSFHILLALFSVCVTCFSNVGMAMAMIGRMHELGLAGFEPDPKMAFKM